MLTYSSKSSYHPDLQKLKSKLKQLEAARDSLAQRMKLQIAQVLDKFGDRFSSSRAYQKSEHIIKDSPTMTPCQLHHAVTAIVDGIKNLLVLGSTSLEDAVQKLVDENQGELLSGLIDLRTNVEKEKHPSQWDPKEAMARLSFLKDAYRSILSLDVFDENKALEIQNDLSKTKKELFNLTQRLLEELPSIARLHMCTIGSSHKLSTATSLSDSAPFNSDDEFDLDDGFRRMNLNGSNDSITVQRKKESIVIFDEAGCIPSYELLGLSRLGLDIKSLVLVGDKHQLSPYDSSQHGNSAGRNPVRKQQQSSLLDISILSQRGQKTNLTTQYHVPKDIASILNIHVDSGLYNTCPCAPVPCLNVVHVNARKDDGMTRKKYVNINEIICACEIIDGLRTDDSISNILIITPVSKSIHLLSLFYLSNFPVAQPTCVFLNASLDLLVQKSTARI